MTVPPQEWATSTVGPSCSANARRVAATDSASVVSGFCTAVTCKPAAWRREITSAQLEPSAHAPCTSTTLRASAGLAACADASAAKSVAESILMATTAPFRSVFILNRPTYSFTALLSLSTLVTPPCGPDAWRRRALDHRQKGVKSRDLSRGSPGETGPVGRGRPPAAT